MKLMAASPGTLEDALGSAHLKLHCDLNKWCKTQLDLYPQLRDVLDIVNLVEPENKRLLIPSDFSDAEQRSLGIQELAGVEYSLQEGQAHNALDNVTGFQGRKPWLVVWLRTGVSSGNRPTNIIENTGNTAGIARRLGCLECLGRLSWMPWESSGISEIARAAKRTLSDSDSWTDDPADRSVSWMRLLYELSTTIRSDGDYPSEGIPL